ncbi:MULTISPECIES: hypothetical protein [Bacillaceae]|uniref:hypothetical protein n=1 Tax=Anoxybacillaceae TaxID=3120669 RepID=UPI0007887908|nr:MULTISPECIES: hypothetical protein [Bacillaceae]PDM38748.1 hypothetical protein CN643_17750 [Parageobacillus yumthangensis]PUF85579.1 hypothetical protein DCC82_16940 [Geobacillus sp. LYN3]RDV23794.1 hypothetical protein DXK91_00495 [Parageobacillus toebii]TXK84424.1 hypothetical protein FVE68_16610 [Geobacillus sp. AYS3]
MDKLSKISFGAAITIFIILAIIAIGAIYIFQKDGLISEDYNTFPPEAKLITNNEEYILSLEAHTWEVGNIVSENKMEENISVYALGQKKSPIEANKKQMVKLQLIKHQEFKLEQIMAYLWRDANQKDELKVEGNHTFILPNNPGNYILELNIQSNRGHAQYVGKIVVK